MAVNDTPWCGRTDNKLYLQSGAFTSTLKTSQDISGVELNVFGISWDGTNTPWTGISGDKLYLQSAQFTSTMKTSEDVTAIEDLPGGISWDGTDTPWTGFAGKKLYLQSGQFTSTMKTSEDVSGTDGNEYGVSFDGTNTPWIGFNNDKLYLQSGEFTSTLKTSQGITSIDALPSGISWNGTDTPWCGYQANKLYMQSGQFTSTLKTSQDLASVETAMTGIETNDVDVRLGMVSDTITPNEQTLTLAQGTPTVLVVIHNTETPSAQALILALPVPVVALIVNPTITPGEQALTLALPVPTISLVISATVTPSEQVLTIALPIAVAGVGDIVLPAAQALVLAQQTPFAYNGLTLIEPSEIAMTLALPDISIDVSVNVIISDLEHVSMSLDVVAFEDITSTGVKNIVTNTRNFAISEYNNFAFNSMARFNNKYLFARADGIYEGGGSNDDGTNIDASYKTGAIDTYATEVQRLRNAYLTFRSNADIQLFSVGDESNSRAYTITNSTQALIHERRVKFERGIRDRYFNFGISNIKGSTFGIRTAKVLSEPIRKRR